MNDIGRPLLEIVHVVLLFCLHVAAGLVSIREHALSDGSDGSERTGRPEQSHGDDGSLGGADIGEGEKE